MRPGVALILLDMRCQKLEYKSQVARPRASGPTAKKPSLDKTDDGGGPIILPPPPSKEVVEWVLYQTKFLGKKLPFVLKKGFRLGRGKNQEQEL